jgi:hypothetical protein
MKESIIMSNDSIHQALASAAEGNAAGFDTHINAALMDKVRERLDLKRLEIASSLLTPEGTENAE